MTFKITFSLYMDNYSYIIGLYFFTTVQMFTFQENGGCFRETLALKVIKNLPPGIICLHIYFILIN